MTTAKSDPWATDDEWESQTDNSPFRKIGDGDGEVLEVRGLLTRVSEDQFGGPMYHITQSDGSKCRLYSNWGYSPDIKAAAVGEIIIIKFAGWVPQKKSGKLSKRFEVVLFGGDKLPPELTEAFPKWRKIPKPASIPILKRKEEAPAGPSFADAGRKADKPAGSLNDPPSALDAEDALPF